jgi:hypothetical protein
MSVAAANPPLQRTWSSLTLGAAQLNGKVVSRLKPSCP